jgi:hypothetical protein
MKSLTILIAVTTVLAALMAMPLPVQAQQDQWNETVPVAPTGTQIILGHVSKGDLIEGNFTADGGPVNFYIMLLDAFISQVEYGTNRPDVPLYKTNLKTEGNFSVAIPFDGTVVAMFENPRIQTQVNVTYFMDYTEGGASYLRQGRVYDDIIVVAPHSSEEILIPYVFVGDEVNIGVYSLDGSVSVYTFLDERVSPVKLPTYYQEIYPLMSQSVMNEITVIKQPLFASGHLRIYIHNPTLSSNRTVVYTIQYAERGPIMRVVLVGIENGKCILPFGIAPGIPFENLTTGAILTFVLDVYNFMSRAYYFLIGLPLAGPVIERVWNIIYGIIMPLWAY